MIALGAHLREITMSSIKKIIKIEIKNIKGISHKAFAVEVFPNMPNILVAPNGYGKSSIATAFASLSSSKIEISDDDRHNGSSTAIPELILTYQDDDSNEYSLKADGSQNQISSVFDISVIRCRIAPKARNFSFGGRNISTPSIDISDITLVKKIPPKLKLTYSYTEEKAKFGKNGKIIPNISNTLSNHRILFAILSVDFSKEDLVSSHTAIANFKNYINSLDGSKANILENFDETKLSQVTSIPHINAIVTLLKTLPDAEENNVVLCLSAVQICDIHKNQKADCRGVKKYAHYVIEKETYISELDSFKKTWKAIAPQEQGGSLILKFPKANQISNGERDTLCLASELIRARFNSKKDNSLIIIDEVFDYLDDSNLIACQYHLTKLTSLWKSDGKRLIPIILTHLDPVIFGTLLLKIKKLHI